MTSQASPLRSVAILGASGNLGVEIVKALLSHPSPFQVTIITRTSSASKTEALFATFPNAKENLTVRSVDSYLSHDALLAALRGIDCVVSTIATFSIPQQKIIIDAAIAAGVQRFFASEYGVDTSNRETLTEYLPLALLKREIIEYLQSHEDKISWTALIVGAFFDWSLKLPGVLAFNLPESKAVVFDGGDIPYEATNIAQIGRAVAACLSTPERISKTKNQYVYVNSFTVTQNQVLALVDKYTGGKKIEITHVKAQDMLRTAKKQLASNGVDLRDFEPTPEKPYLDGSIPMIWSAIFGNGGFNHYSQSHGLWNETLGLPKESLEDTLKTVVQELGFAP